MNGERPAGEQGEHGGVPRPSPAMPAWTIEQRETTARRLPLNRRYSGSAYSMTNRCTIIIHLSTRESVVGVAAHLPARVPQGTYVECVDEDRDPIFRGPFANRPTIADGRYALPERPGFGIDFDREYTVGTRSTSR